MKIVFLTTYNQVCGISDYSMSLVKHFSDEHEIKIIAPKLTGNHHSVKPVVGEDKDDVYRLFNATIWDGIVSVDMKEIVELAEWADVFHIQFQDALYHHQWFPLLIERIKGKAKLAITLHDSCLGKVWPYLKDFDLILTMKPDVKNQVQNAKLIGMPMYDFKPVIKGFGLGRSRHDEIERVCSELGYKYEFIKAEDKWLPIDDLLTWLRDSDGIVLYYNEVSTAGSSAGARTALSTRRPVFVNNVQWFNDIPDGVTIRFDNNEDLKQRLKDTFDNDYISQNSFNRIADEHITLYNLLR